MGAPAVLWTMTLKLQAAETLPAGSAAVQLTGVVPIGNIEPDAGVQVTVAPQLSVAVTVKLTATGPPPGEQAERLRRAVAGVDPGSVDGLVLHTKVARIASMLDHLTDDAFRCDMVPNLFLVERLLDRQHPVVVRGLRAELAPLLARIPTALRTAFNTLVDARVAPSPFCTDEPRSRRLN